MNWNDYTDLMAANGQKVYAEKAGHHGVYSGVEKTSPTVYPHRLDTHEMRLDWVMREVWPSVKSCQSAGYKVLYYWLEHRSALLKTMIGDVTRRLVEAGYQVVEKEQAGRGHWLEISWSEPKSA